MVELGKLDDRFRGREALDHFGAHRFDAHVLAEALREVEAFLGVGRDAFVVLLDRFGAVLREVRVGIGFDDGDEHDFGPEGLGKARGALDGVGGPLRSVGGNENSLEHVVLL